MLASPALDRREVAAVSGGGILLALLLHWPLLMDFGHSVPKDVGDPIAQAWQVAWGGHALRNQPLDFFHANQFWPSRNTLAYSDALIGYAPAGLLGSGPFAAIARYDALFLFTQALCFVGAYLLGRELGLGRSPAVLAGIAFAYSPYRLEQFNHLHILSSGGIPLALFLLLRGHRRSNVPLVFCGWLVTAWQLLLTISLGLLLVYLLGSLGLWSLWSWWRRGRPAPIARVLAAHVVGLLVVALSALWMGRAYLAVVRELPQASRSLDDIAFYSGAVVWSYLAAAEESTLWGPVTSFARDRLTFPSEQTLFPGATVVLLAIAGIVVAGGPFDRRLRVLLGVCVSVCAVLAVGTATAGPKAYSPYRLLYEFGPGFDAIRVPGRVSTLTTLGLGLLAGAGAQRLASALRGRSSHSALQLCVPVLALLVLFEGSALRTADDDPGSFRTPRVEPAPSGFSAVRGPTLHLPARAEDNRHYLLWSTDGFTPIANGKSSVTPPRFLRLVETSSSFPDSESVSELREFGVCSVALHLRHLDGTPWQPWATRPVDGLGVTRTELADLVVYDLHPGATCAR